MQAGSAPTGAPIFDAILVFTFAGLVVWTGASAPWWAGVATAAVGCDPALMGLGPVGAIRSVLAKAGWKLDEVDAIEINEACT